MTLQDWWADARQRLHDSRFCRAWRYWRRRSTADDAVQISYELEGVADIYPLVSIAVLDAVEDAVAAGYVDGPDLRRYLRDACQEMAEAWDQSNSGAHERAIALACELAWQDRVVLTRLRVVETA